MTSVNKFPGYSVPQEIIAIGTSNIGDSNVRFFKGQYKHRVNLTPHLDRLAKEGMTNGYIYKTLINDFVNRVIFQNNRSNKKLINSFYDFAHLIKDEETFDEIRVKIRARLTDPKEVEYLNNVKFGDSTRIRLLKSIVTDPLLRNNLDQFDLDFDRQKLLVLHDGRFYSKIEKDQFIGIVNGLFRNRIFSNQILNFFQQTSKQYSLYRAYQSEKECWYKLFDECFYFQIDGQSLDFGYYHVFGDRRTGDVLFHDLEYKFDLSRKVDIDIMGFLVKGSEVVQERKVMDFDDEQSLMSTVVEFATPVLKSLMSRNALVSN